MSERFVCGHCGRRRLAKFKSATGHRPPPCVDCWASYQREYRQTNPSYAERNRLRIMARNRALRRLGERHPATLERFYDEELRKCGVAP